MSLCLNAVERVSYFYMPIHSSTPPPLLLQDDTCEVIRVILASSSGCTVGEIGTRLSQPANTIQALLNVLVSEGFVEERRAKFLLTIDFNTDSVLREAVLDYENRWLARRAKEFPIDVVSRFRVTDALGQMISHARSKIK